LRKHNIRPLVLGADNDGLLMWYVDASFAVHRNMRGHTGGGLMMGRGCSAHRLCVAYWAVTHVIGLHVALAV
jgi:hypothetical protein